MPFMPLMPFMPVIPFMPVMPFMPFLAIGWINVYVYGRYQVMAYNLNKIYMIKYQLS